MKNHSFFEQYPEFHFLARIKGRANSYLIHAFFEQKHHALIELNFYKNTLKYVTPVPGIVENAQKYELLGFIIIEKKSLTKIVYVMLTSKENLFLEMDNENLEIYKNVHIEYLDFTEVTDYLKKVKKKKYKVIKYVALRKQLKNKVELALGMNRFRLPGAIIKRDNEADDLSIEIERFWSNKILFKKKTKDKMSTKQKLKKFRKISSMAQVRRRKKKHESMAELCSRVNTLSYHKIEDYWYNPKTKILYYLVKHKKLLRRKRRFFRDGSRYSLEYIEQPTHREKTHHLAGVQIHQTNENYLKYTNKYLNKSINHAFVKKDPETVTTKMVFLEEKIFHFQFTKRLNDPQGNILERRNYILTISANLYDHWLRPIGKTEIVFEGGVESAHIEIKWIGIKKGRFLMFGIDGFRKTEIFSLDLVNFEVEKIDGDDDENGRTYGGYYQLVRDQRYVLRRLVQGYCYWEKWEFEVVDLDEWARKALELREDRDQEERG